MLNLRQEHLVDLRQEHLVNLRWEQRLVDLRWTDLLLEKIVQINPLQKKQPLVGSNKADIWIILVDLRQEQRLVDLRQEQRLVDLRWEILICLRQDNSF